MPQIRGIVCDDHIDFEFDGWFNEASGREFVRRDKIRGSISISPLDKLVLPCWEIWVSDDTRIETSSEQYVERASQLIRDEIDDRLGDHSFVELLTIANNSAKSFEMDFSVLVSAPRAGSYITWKAGDLEGRLEIKADKKFSTELNLSIIPYVKVVAKAEGDWVEGGKVCDWVPDTTSDIMRGDVDCSYTDRDEPSTDNANIVFDYASGIEQVLNAIY